MTAPTALQFQPPTTGKYDPSRPPDGMPGWRWATNVTPNYWSYAGGLAAYQRDRAAAAAAGGGGQLFGLSYTALAALGVGALLLWQRMGGRR